MSTTVSSSNEELALRGYKIVKKLGQGAFGCVYLANATAAASDDVNSTVVLKELFIGDVPLDETVPELREAKLLKHLNHANIVRYLNVVTISPHVFIIMEYCQGGDLYQALQRLKAAHKTVSTRMAMNWLIEIALGLHYIHERRILHRDLKSRNIFVSASGTLKLGDFGVARLLDRTMEEASTFAGTPTCMAPEVIRGEKYRSTSDIWSLGCILYEICTFDPPFQASNILALMRKICDGPIPSLPGQYGDNLQNVFKRLLDRDATSRPTSVEVFQMPYVAKHVARFHDQLSRTTARLSQDRARIRKTMSASSRELEGGPHPPLSHSGSSLASLPEGEPAAAGGAADDDDDDDASLTPQQRRQRRRQRDADQRAEVLKQAVAKQREENGKIDRQRLHSPSVAGVIPGVPAASASRTPSNPLSVSQPNPPFPKASTPPLRSRSNPPDFGNDSTANGVVPPWIAEHPDVFPGGIAPDLTTDEERRRRRRRERHASRASSRSTPQPHESSSSLASMSSGNTLAVDGISMHSGSSFASDNSNCLVPDDFAVEDSYIGDADEDEREREAERKQLDIQQLQGHMQVVLSAKGAEPPPKEEVLEEEPEAERPIAAPAERAAALREQARGLLGPERFEQAFAMMTSSKGVDDAKLHKLLGDHQELEFLLAKIVFLESTGAK